MLYGNMKQSSQKEIELPKIDSTLVLNSIFTFVYFGRSLKEYHKHIVY